MYVQLTVNHNGRVLERVSLAGLTTSKEQGSHAGRLAETERVHGRRNVLHRVVDCEAGSDAAARRVDVQPDGARRVLGLEEEELRRDERAHRIGDLWGCQRSCSDIWKLQGARNDSLGTSVEKRASET